MRSAAPDRVLNCAAGLLTGAAPSAGASGVCPPLPGRPHGPALSWPRQGGRRPGAGLDQLPFDPSAAAQDPAHRRPAPSGRSPWPQNSDKGSTKWLWSRLNRSTLLRARRSWHELFPPTPAPSAVQLAPIPLPMTGLIHSLPAHPPPCRSRSRRAQALVSCRSPGRSGRLRPVWSWP